MRFYVGPTLLVIDELGNSRSPQGRLRVVPGRRASYLKTSIIMNVKGHRDLPTGGQQTCPVVATSSAQWWPRNCPVWSRGLAIG